MKVFLIVLKFLFVSALFIVSNYNLSLIDSHDFVQFKDIYFDWLGNVIDYGSEITGYVVDYEWLPPLNASVENSFPE